MVFNDSLSLFLQEGCEIETRFASYSRSPPQSQNILHINPQKIWQEMSEGWLEKLTWSVC